MAKQPGLAGNPGVEITELRYQLSDKNSEISRLQLNLKAAEDELENTRRQLFAKKAEYNQAEEKIMELSADVGKWKSAANRGGGGGGGGASEDSLQKGMEIEKLRREVVTLRKELQDTQEDLKQERSKKLERRPSAPVEHYRVQIQHVQDENKRLTSDLLSATDQLEQLKIDNDNLRYEIQNGRGYDRRGGGDMYTGGNTSLQEELDYYKRSYQSVVDTNTAMHQQALIYEDDFKREKQEREEANARYKKAQDEIQQLRTRIQEMGGTPTGSRPDDYTDRGRERDNYRHPQTTASYGEGRDDQGRLVTSNRSFSPTHLYNTPPNRGDTSQREGEGERERSRVDDYYTYSERGDSGYSPPAGGGNERYTYTGGRRDSDYKYERRGYYNN